jgi:hypothetical protein
MGVGKDAGYIAGHIASNRDIKDANFKTVVSRSLIEQLSN